MYRKSIFVILAVIILSFTAMAQSETGFVKSEDGIVAFNKQKGNTFLFEIKGKEIKQSGDVLFVIDGRPTSVIILDKNELVGEKKIEKTDEILKFHQTWESDYHSEQFGKKVIGTEGKFESLKTSDSTNLTTYFWGFTRPDTQDSSYNRDYFMTTVVGDKVIILGSPLEPTEDSQILHKFFNEVLSSLEMIEEN